MRAFVVFGYTKSDKLMPLQLSQEQVDELCLFYKNCPFDDRVKAPVLMFDFEDDEQQMVMEEEERCLLSKLKKNNSK